MSDLIFIEKLELGALIGVSDEERSQPQRLTVSLILEPTRGLTDLRDRASNTVDYAVVCANVQELAAKRSRHLIETLAEEIAEHLLRRFTVSRVQVEVHKYILPDTVCVGVRIERAAGWSRSAGVLRTRTDA